MLRQEGQRISRHYYDLHCLFSSEMGQAALADRSPAIDCITPARMFFDRPDLALASAAPGSFALAPVEGAVETPRRDYPNMTAMIFGGKGAAWFCQRGRRQLVYVLALM